jgi:hypothetical protein
VGAIQAAGSFARVRDTKLTKARLAPRLVNDEGEVEAALRRGARDRLGMLQESRLPPSSGVIQPSPR